MTNADSVIAGINVQNDGKILIHGFFSNIGTVEQRRLARLLPTGSLDASFVPVIDAHINQVVLQPDGKMLVGGSFSNVNGQACVSLTRLNDDGSTDVSFTSPPLTYSGHPEIYQMVVQPNGKILIAGKFTAVASTSLSGIARLNADGSLDSTFNPGVNVSSHILKSLVLQRDGKVLIASDSTLGLASVPGHTAQLNVIRLLDTGAVDSSFGLIADGTVHNVALQSDGGILLAGNWQYLNSNYDYNQEFTIPRKVVRVNPVNGITDTTFQILSDQGFTGMSLQADGKLLLSGPAGLNRHVNSTPATGGLLRVENTASENHFWIRSDINVFWQRTGTAPEPSHVTFEVSTDGNHWELIGTGIRSGDGWELGLSSGRKLPADCLVRARARTVGGEKNQSSGLEERIAARGLFKGIAAVADQEFSSNLPSIITGATGRVDTVTAVQADGKILLGGSFPGTGVRLIRLNRSGTQDTGFSCNLASGDKIQVLIAQPDGKILIGGTFGTVHGASRKSVARLNSDGSLDTSFGDPGISTGIGPGTGPGSVFTMLLQPDGKIVVGGHFYYVGSTYRWAIVRLLPDGTRDTSFMPPTDSSPYVMALALQPDGKILVGCDEWEDGVIRRGLVRLEVDGSLDTAFNPGVAGGNAIGTEVTTFYSGEVRSIAVLPDNKILIAGYFLTVGGTPRANIALLTEDGDLVSNFNVGRHFSRPAYAGEPPQDNVNVQSMAVQTDGKVILAGEFRFHRQFRYPAQDGEPAEVVDDPEIWGLYRFDTNGVPDATFRADLFGQVSYYSNVSLLNNGQVLTSPPAIYSNQSPLRQMAVTSPDHIQWIRQGTHHEAQRVTFEHSADRSTWTSVGNGERISGGWEWNGASLPVAGWIRARAEVITSNSGNVQERILRYPATVMTVSGNSVPIQNGAFWTSSGDHTEFLIASGPLVTTTRTYTIQNTGSHPLEISEINLEGVSADAFSVSGITLPATVAVSATQTFTITFSPPGYSNHSATVAIESNGSSPNPYTFAILGKVDSSSIEVTSWRPVFAGSTAYDPANGTDFGPLSVIDGKQISYVISNSGSQPLTISSVTVTGQHASDFQIEGLTFPLTLYPQDKAVMKIRALPGGLGHRYATITINNNHPVLGTFDFNVRAFGSVPRLSISGNSLVINDGDTSPGLADHTTFVSTNEGSSSTRTFTAANVGNADYLTISNVQITGPAAGDFAIGWTSAYLAHAGHENALTSSKDLVVTFTPSKYGWRKATLTFTTNEPGNNQYSFDVQGLGLFRRLEVIGNGSVITDGSTTPNLTDGTNLGSTVTSQTAERMFTVRNGANISVNVTGLSLTGTGAGSFTAKNMDDSALSWPVALDEGESLPIKVSFTPSSVGTYSAELTVTHDNPDTGNLGYDFDLLGEGVTLGAVETAFNPGIASGTSYTVSAIATQADGKILIGGNFNGLVAGTTRSRMARLNSGGTLDSSFDPKPNNLVNAIAVQRDGKIVIGGTFTTLQPNGAATTTARLRIARLNTDGTLDTAFNPGISNGAVSALAIQSDGKILVAGTFTGTVGGTARPRLARLNTDGTLDTTFNADIRNGVVNCIALDGNGNILAGGTFTSVAGVTTISRISRFNSWDGTRDTGFTVTTAGGTTAVSALAVQPDGQVLIGGVFTTINGTTRNRIARVSSSGVLDSGFNPNANTGTVESIVLQTDGQILFGGTFTQIGGTVRNRLARVTAAGALDSFNPNMGGAVEGIVVQNDGKVLV
ncbi:MAG TPA: hypothetical protein DCP71_12600, partial [Verrucomicrobiales bacterium]|nr:hypothetical protein [Verrucomicrobiales bacterium]